MPNEIFSKMTGISDWIKSRSLIDESFIFRGSIKELIDSLETTKDPEKIRFYLSKLHNDSFQITDVSSVGTAILNYRAVKGITIYGEIKSLNNNIQIIHIRSKFRFEISVLIAVCIFFYIGMIINKGIPFWVYFFPLIPIPWFIWIYKIQTEGLVKKLKKYFRWEQLDKIITTT